MNRFFYSIFIAILCGFKGDYCEEYSTPIGKPMQEAANFIKIIQSLPRYAEAGYSPLGRSPVVDACLADLFYMREYAEIVTKLRGSTVTK